MAGDNTVKKSRPPDIAANKDGPAFTSTLNALDFRLRLTEILQQISEVKERFKITHRGKPIAAVVSIEDLELLEELEQFMKINRALRSRREGALKFSKPSDR